MTRSRAQKHLAPVASDSVRDQNRFLPLGFHSEFDAGTVQKQKADR